MDEFSSSHHNWHEGRKGGSKMFLKKLQHFRHQNVERLTVDGIDNDKKSEILDGESFYQSHTSDSHPDDFENIKDDSVIYMEKSNSEENGIFESFAVERTESKGKSILERLRESHKLMASPDRSDISTKIGDLLAANDFKGIHRLKETLKMKLLRKLLDSNYILEQIERYKDNNRKKKEMIVKQRMFIDRMRGRKVKKPTEHKKVHFIPIDKPVKKQKGQKQRPGGTFRDLELGKPAELKTHLSDHSRSLSEEGRIEPKELKSGISEEETQSSGSESISCPSESDPGASCQCSKGCTCNEYARFLNYLSKKQEMEMKRKNLKQENKSRNLDEPVVRWADFERLHYLPPVSSESSLEVSSTSSSDCSVVRPCHCNHECCGCSEYREYLKYKLDQVVCRKRKRQKKRVENAANVDNAIDQHYEEDEYNQKVKQFINEHFIAEKCCKCGLHNCKCKIDKDEYTPSVEEGSIETGSPTSSVMQDQNESKQKDISEDNGMKVVGDDSITVQELKEHGNQMKRWASMDFYEKVSILIDKSGGVENVDIKDVLSPTEPPEKHAVPTFDDDVKCQCHDYEKYYQHIKKERRLAEKRDPFAKYFRKRLIYVMNMMATRELLNNTSSDTDDPVIGPLTQKCKKYAFDQQVDLRRRKVLKKKRHKLEKQVLLNIISRGSHLAPCQCLANKDKVKATEKKTKIDPSISIDNLSHADCIIGMTDRFPDCLLCKKVQFSKNKQFPPETFSPQFGEGPQYTVEHNKRAYIDPSEAHASSKTERVGENAKGREAPERKASVPSKDRKPRLSKRKKTPKQKSLKKFKSKTHKKNIGGEMKKKPNLVNKTKHKRKSSKPKKVIIVGFASEQRRVYEPWEEEEQKISKVLCNIVSILGYDGYTTCTKPFRGGKSRLDVPCDFTTQNWCTVPGSYYPWRAVRRFVYENHGLMRRMYGSERHISVLRSEIESNDVDYQNEKWSQESNLKHYKLKKEEFKATHKTTTTQAPTTNRTSVPDITTSTRPETTTESDFTTTNFDFESTTEFLTTTLKTESESKPQIFQDTLEKSSTTTEKAQLFYKTKGVNACPVKEEVVAPFWANNTRGEVLALLNLYPFEQYVHWERCTFENKQMFCREGCRCEQQYRLHRLLAYDPSNDCRGIFSDWFKFPSCCVCRCYDLPSEFRLTSRSPRKDNTIHN